MTRVIPQIVNTKSALRSAVLALPDNVKVQALLGLDGDCDFSVRASESYPFRCSKEDLLSLIDRQVQETLLPMAQSNDYLVLDRRYAVYLPELLGDTAAYHCRKAV
jgi:hypothetical protein